MTQLYENPEQEALHLKAMESLANETGQEFDLVKKVYEMQFARLREKANITNFVVLLSSRKTREALRKPAMSERLESVPA